MKFKHFSWLIVLCIVVFQFGLFLGCSKGTVQSGTSGGIVTIPVKGLGGTFSAGIQENTYWSEILAEKLGVRLDIIASTEETVNAMMVARDIPALFAHDIRFASSAIEAGLFLDLNPYEKQMPNVFRYKGMVDNMRDNFSNGTGALYGIRSWVGLRTDDAAVNRVGPFVRWDYYKELGYPEIVELEDYLPVLKAMQDRHPVNEAGQKNYAISLFNEWDENSMAMASWGTYMLNSPQNLTNYLEYNVDTKIYNSYLDENSAYKRMLKFYNAAFRMGLLDPDSITQKFATFIEKAEAGRFFFVSNIWGYGTFNTTERTAKGIGFKILPFKNEKMFNTAMGRPTGGEYFIGIAKDKVEKDPLLLEKILQFLDYYYSPDGQIELNYGKKGIAWDVDSSGEPYFTELGWKLLGGSEAEFPNGGKIKTGFCWIADEPATTAELHPIYKRRLDGTDWIRKDYAPLKETALDVDWNKKYNAINEMDYLIRNNHLVDLVSVTLPVMPEDLLIILQRISDVVKPSSWQAVYAKDEVEFNKVWEKMVTDAKNLGIDRLNQWEKEEHAKALAGVSKYITKP
jgi:putative aldouronate transport system substrate-binding protein